MAQSGLLNRRDEFGEGAALVDVLESILWLTAKLPNTNAVGGDDAEAGDDDAWLLCHVRGKVMVHVVPWSGWLSKAMVPRCSVTMLWTIERPRPVPLDFVVKKGSKM